MIRGRDIEQLLRSRGFERGTTHALVALAEQHSHLRKEVLDIANLVNQMSEIIQGMTAVAENMKVAVERINREMDTEDMSPATQLLGDDE